MDSSKLDPIYVPLRITFGLIPLLAGLDKFVGLLADWGSYLSPSVVSLLPFSAGTFMALVGVIEMAVGVAILTKWPREGAYIASAWLVLIAVNLIAAGVLDVAVRDLAMAVAAFSLGRLAALRADVPEVVTGDVRQVARPA